MLANTLMLMIPVVVLAIGLGIAVGTWLGWRRGERVEELGAVLVLVPRALPVFWTGIVFLSLFAYKLQWFPIGGIHDSIFFPQRWYQFTAYFDMAPPLGQAGATLVRRAEGHRPAGIGTVLNQGAYT